MRELGYQAIRANGGMTMYDNKTLYLQAMGCDFWKDDQELLEHSDCQNYRIRGYIVDKYGRDLFVEFGAGCKYRTTNKRTGQPLKKAILEHKHKLCIIWQGAKYIRQS